MGVALVVPAIEQNLRLASRLWIIPIRHRHERQIRRGPNPHATEAHLDAADQVQFLHEHRAFVELAVAIRVLEHDDAILPFALRLPLRIRHPFDHPKASAIIDAEGDGLHHVRLAGEERRLEPGGQCHLLRGSLSRKPGEFHVIRRWWRRVWRERLARAGVGLREYWLLRVETEVIEVNVRPMPLLPVHHADENLLPLLPAQVRHHRAQFL